MLQKELITEGKRQMQICNACRYCEGYCAVWRAIEHRREFHESDMAYLANLCHDCKDCYFACPFTAPHEFGINPPQLFSSLREDTYKKYAWPRGLASTVANHKLSFYVTSAIALILFLVGVACSRGQGVIWHRHMGAGSFYSVIPEAGLEVIFGVLGFWFLAGWLIGAVRYWVDIKSDASGKVTRTDIRTATTYAVKLRYLGRQGDGGEELSGARKWLHHAVFYGFVLDLISTTLGAFYSHVLKVQAPYPVYNPVVLFGMFGGIGIIIGTAGLIWVKMQSHRNSTYQSALKSGIAFSASLLCVALTGMLLLLLRDTSAMPIVLVLHLGTVASLFFTAPFTKFVHFIYRYLALIRYAQEERVASETQQSALASPATVQRQSRTGKTVRN